jgi:eukaryotic-like serine/threonine-protein kinase
VKALFQAAVERPAAERDAFLVAATGDDDALRREVESLLASDAGGSLDDRLAGAAEAFLADQPAIQASLRSAMLPRAVFTPGVRVGSYEVVAPLGAGAMGEVYRARDMKLNRDVALKVLLSVFALDPDRVARFKREAQVLASLNHPNIAAIYGLEESNGAQALVLELVDGPTLADQITLGPTRLGEALTIARQIAEGLEAAHGQGIIHRDLKPANIKVAHNGVVKVLDFGLAKVWQGAPEFDVSASPTLSATHVREGTIIGTPAYMSPEQARGKALDKRTDIWSFGCVLFEMLVGRRPFTGETITDTIARVLEREPDWQLLPESTPVRIRDLLRRCLQKDANRRLHDIADARIELDEALGILATPTAGESLADAAPWRRGAVRISPFRLAMAIGALTALALLVAAQFKTSPGQSPGPPAHFTVQLPPNIRLTSIDFPAIAISPDGSLVTYVATRGGQPELFVRPMNTMDARPLSGTANATTPFFSPDSRWIGFFADGQLKKVSTAGGPPITLCAAPVGAGASWGANGVIVFTGTTGSGLSRVSDTGGKPEPVTQLDAQKGEFSHRWPEWLPDQRAVVYTVGTTGSWDDAQIVGQSVPSGERSVLVRGGTNPHYVSGHLLYSRGGAIMAVPFDPASLTATGTPVRVLDNVVQSFDGAAQFSVSPSGSAVYIAGVFESDQRTLATVDRSGAATPLAAPPRPYATPRLSPDGRRLLVTIEQAMSELWEYDIAPGTLTQLTFDAGARFPVWNPGGQRAAFSSNKSGALNLFVLDVSRPGTGERLTTSDNLQAAGSWSPDGQTLAFVEQHPTKGRDIRLFAPSDRSIRPWLDSMSEEGAPRFSLDGRWLAYVSNESGRNEVYIRMLAGSSRQQPVSNNGGTEPVWARDGRELFYREGDKMMAVGITVSGANLQAARPVPLFAGRFAKGSIDAANYDVTSDGQRFLMVQSDQQSVGSTMFHVLIHWVGGAGSTMAPLR